MVRALFAILILCACRTPEPTPITAAPAPVVVVAAPEPPAVVRPQIQEHREIAGPEEPTLASEPDPANWRHNGGMTDAQADAMCAKELPGCKHPFGIYTMPPSPCAHQGTLCTQVQSRFAGTWTCGCEACGSDKDCKPNEHCDATRPPCSYARVAMRCVTGPRAVQQPCMEPAVP